MTRRAEIGAGIIALVMVGLLLGFCARHKGSVPAREAFSVDSAKATKPAADSTRKAVVDSAKRVVTKIVVDSTALLTARKEIARLHRLADSALAVANAPQTKAVDSSEINALRTVVDARTQEAVQLHAVVDSQAADLTVAHGTILALSRQITSDEARLATYEIPNVGLVDRLAADVKKASECHIAWIVPCPSRRLSFVGGVASDELVRFAVRNRAKLGLSVAF